MVYELLVLFFICENHIIAIDIFNDLPPSFLGYDGDLYHCVIVHTQVPMQRRRNAKVRMQNLMIVDQAHTLSKVKVIFFYLIHTEIKFRSLWLDEFVTTPNIFLRPCNCLCIGTSDC